MKSPIEIIETVCLENDHQGIYSVGANAALRAMSKYWVGHLAEGHDPKIISDDINGMQELLETMRTNIMRAIEGDTAVLATADTKVELPAVVIDMDGGVLNCVRSTLPIRVVFLDSDTEGVESDCDVIMGANVYTSNFVLSSEAGPFESGVNAVHVALVLAEVDQAALAADVDDEDGDTDGSTEYCTKCNEPLEVGQIGLCDSCQEDEEASTGTVAAMSLSELYVLWRKLGDIPVSEGTADMAEGSIEEPFLHFPIGSHREGIWSWFEEQNPRFVVGEVMQGIRLPD